MDMTHIPQSRAQVAGEEARGRKTRVRGLDFLVTLLVFALLTLWAAASLLPLYWMFTTSIKWADAVVQVPPQWIPHPITFQPYRRLFSYPNTYLWFLNSLIVATAVTAGRVLICSLAGYTFAKLRFPGRNPIFWIILATLMIPDQVILVPLYSLVLRLKWLNTYQALIIPPLGSAFYIFLMKQFMQTLPTSLIDAARLDNCSEFGIFWKVILPLAKPGIAVLAVFSFTGIWNAFFWPLLVAPSARMFTIQVGLTFLRYGPLDWGMLMAGASAAAIPVIIVFLVCQRYFMRGLTIGALKG